MNEKKIFYKTIERILICLSHPELNYVSNTIEPSYPVGIDVEVFSYEALKTAWENAKGSAEREHVTPYIICNPSLFKISNY